MESASRAGANGALETLLSPARTTAIVGSGQRSAELSGVVELKEQNPAAWIRKDHGHVDELTDRLREQVSIVPHNCPESWILHTLDRFQDFRADVQEGEHDDATEGDDGSGLGVARS